MFGKVIGLIILAFVPVDSEFAVGALIAEPVPSHVPGFGPALFDVGMDKAVGRGIVCFDGCGLLGMTECGKGNSTRNGLLSVAIDTAGLCFSSRAHYALDCFANCQDRTIWFREGLGR